MRVFVRVIVRVAVAVCVNVAVNVDVAVGVRDGVRVCVCVLVALGVIDVVLDALAVMVLVGVRDDVSVTVRVFERVAVTTGPVIHPPLSVASRLRGVPLMPHADTNTKTAFWNSVLSKFALVKITLVKFAPLAFALRRSAPVKLAPFTEPAMRAPRKSVFVNVLLSALPRTLPCMIAPVKFVFLTVSALRLVSDSIALLRFRPSHVPAPITNRARLTVGPTMYPSVPTVRYLMLFGNEIGLPRNSPARIFVTVVFANLVL